MVRGAYLRLSFEDWLCVSGEGAFTFIQREAMAFTPRLF